MWKMVIGVVHWEGEKKYCSDFSYNFYHGRKSDSLVSFCYTYIMWCVYEQVLSYYKNKIEQKTAIMIFKQKDLSRGSVAIARRCVPISRNGRYIGILC